MKTKPQQPALLQLQRRISKAPRTEQAFLRLALRGALEASEGRDRLSRLARARHLLELAVIATEGVDPETVLGYLQDAQDALALLELEVARALDQPGRRASVPHGRAEGVA